MIIHSYFCWGQKRNSSENKGQVSYVPMKCPWFYSDYFKFYFASIPAFPDNCSPPPKKKKIKKITVINVYDVPIAFKYS